MAYIENREIKNPDSNNWEIKTQIHEKPKNREIKTNPNPWEINQTTEKLKQPIPIRNQPKEQRNHNQPIPKRNQPKEHREIKIN